MKVSNNHGGRDGQSKQADLDNHSNQMNPNNDEYWGSRGEEQPFDWEISDH